MIFTFWLQQSVDQKREADENLSSWNCWVLACYISFIEGRRSFWSNNHMTKTFSPVGLVRRWCQSQATRVDKTLCETSIRRPFETMKSSEKNAWQVHTLKLNNSVGKLDQNGCPAVESRVTPLDLWLELRNTKRIKVNIFFRIGLPPNHFCLNSDECLFFPNSVS